MDSLAIRKPNRLKDYDYSQNGAYFVTVCTKDRHEILGEILVGDAAFGVPFVRLTETGEMVKQHIEHIDNVSEYVHLNKYTIMPNHIHLIISITGGTPKAASPTKSIISQTVNPKIRAAERFSHGTSRMCIAH